MTDTATLAAQIEHVVSEWQETMRGDDKSAAVARGMGAEIRAVIAAASTQ